MKHHSWGFFFWCVWTTIVQFQKGWFGDINYDKSIKTVNFQHCGLHRFVSIEFLLEIVLPYVFLLTPFYNNGMFGLKESGRNKLREFEFELELIQVHLLVFIIFFFFILTFKFIICIWDSFVNNTLVFAQFNIHT
jgi:hypothetical protein